MRRANEVPRQHRREPKTAQFSGRLSCPLEEYRSSVRVLQPFFSSEDGCGWPILPTQSISITAAGPPPITLTLSP